MKISSILLFSLLLLFAVPGLQAHHAQLPPGMSEPEAAWLWGYHTIPASITRDNSAYWYNYAHSTDVHKISNPAWTEVAARHIKPGSKTPAVLVMHGCSGMFPSPNAYRVFFVERGFALLEPNSYARPGHACETSPLQHRMEDMAYAVEKIRELPWVDQDRVVLMGISQGGRIVARWDKPGFAAHIILANNCDDGEPQAPAGTPVLAVVGEKDEYYKGSSCKVLKQHEASRSIVIPDAPHGIIDYEETADAMEVLLWQLDLL